MTDSRLGTITRRTEPEWDLTVFIVVGQVSAEQILQQILPFLTQYPTLLVLWDFREGSLVQIPTVEFRSIIAQGAPFTASRKGGQTAIVCRNEVDFGLSRMFQSLAEINQIPFEIMVFRNMELARKWLKIGSAPSSEDKLSEG